LVVDFAPHGHDFLRAAAHRRLGFGHQQLRDWFDRAGFDCPTIANVGPPDGNDGLTVTIWLAVDRRAAERPAAASAPSTTTATSTATSSDTSSSPLARQIA
jgi:ArsR family transcriptional regulator